MVSITETIARRSASVKKAFFLEVFCFVFFMYFLFPISGSPGSSDPALPGFPATPDLAGVTFLRLLAKSCQLQKPRCCCWSITKPPRSPPQPGSRQHPYWTCLQRLENAHDWVALQWNIQCEHLCCRCPLPLALKTVSQMWLSADENHRCIKENRAAYWWLFIEASRPCVVRVERRSLRWMTLDLAYWDLETVL